MMTITSYKIGLFSLMCSFCLTGHELYGEGIEVTKLDHGWVCSGPIQYTTPHATREPIICDQSLVILEKHKNKASLKSFMQDDYYMTTLSIPDGHVVGRTKLRFEGHPLQAKGMWPYKKNVVVWSYYQNEPGVFNHINLVTTLDAHGDTIKQHSLDSSSNPMAIDQKDDILLCVYKSPQEKNKENNATDRSVLLYDLNCGVVKSKDKCDSLFYIITDDDGNAYLLRRTILGSTVDNLFGAILEKYSVNPWQCIWTKPIEGESKKYPILCRYHKGFVWYELNNEKGGVSTEERREWNDSPFDAHTGSRVKTPYPFEPCQMIVEIEGKQYKIKWGRMENSLDMFYEVDSIP